MDRELGLTFVDSRHLLLFLLLFACASSLTPKELPVSRASVLLVELEELSLGKIFILSIVAYMMAEIIDIVLASKYVGGNLCLSRSS